MLSGLAETPSLQNASAGLLKFYWFRLAEFAIPTTTALASCAMVGYWFLHNKDRGKKICAAVVAAAIVLAAVLLAVEKHAEPRPNADRRSLPPYHGNELRTQQTYQNWRKVCQWIKDNTAPNAVFITPYEQQTFKWYAERTEVVNWKDIPQDTVSIVEWNRRVIQLLEPQKQIACGLMVYSDEQLNAIAKNYGANYLLIPQHQVNLSPIPTNLRLIYPADNQEKATYLVFELNSESEIEADDNTK